MKKLPHSGEAPLACVDVVVTKDSVYKIQCRILTFEGHSNIFLKEGQYLCFGGADFESR
jgi:hypothetical protein